MDPLVACNFKRRIMAMQALLAICRARSGKPGAVARKVAAAKRTHDRAANKASADRQAAQFSMTMGLGGDGIITLAEGLVDVDVTFRATKRARWSCSRTATVSRGSTRGPGTLGGARKRVDARRRATVEWDSSESEESDSGSEVSKEGHGAAGSEGHAVNPGDRIRIYWTVEEVWFRCDQVVMYGRCSQAPTTSRWSTWLRDGRWRGIAWRT